LIPFYCLKNALTAASRLRGGVTLCRTSDTQSATRYFFNNKIESIKSLKSKKARDFIKLLNFYCSAWVNKTTVNRKKW